VPSLRRNGDKALTKEGVQVYVVRRLDPNGIVLLSAWFDPYAAKFERNRWEEDSKVPHDYVVASVCGFGSGTLGGLYDAVQEERSTHDAEVTGELVQGGAGEGGSGEEA